METAILGNNCQFRYEDQDIAPDAPDAHDAAPRRRFVGDLPSVK
jgi:hypothetical protein